jgi:hypothetical protein
LDAPYPTPETADEPAPRLGRPWAGEPGRFHDGIGHCTDDLVARDVRLLLRHIADALTAPAPRPAPPPVEQDDRDREGRLLLDAYYRECWQRARDLGDPTWWLRHAPPRP